MSELLELHKKNNANLGERNGITVPLNFGDAEVAYTALRGHISVADYSHYTKIKIEGEEAFDFLDFAVAGDVAEIRDEQALHTVILDEKGDILSDVYVLNDDDTYLLICEFINDADMLELLKARKGEFDVEIESLTASHAMITYEGPYSWELMAEIYGMDVIGIPYLGFIAMENDSYVFRAGKHGEYGYKIILPHADAPELWEKALELGEKYQIKQVGLDLQSIGRLENPYFNPEGAAKVSRKPRDLQLQWMVRYDKEEFFGREGLLASRDEPVSRKIVGLVAQKEGESEAMAVGDKVMCGGEEIGEIVNAGYSAALKKYIAQGFIKAEFAYASI
ncbi:MAG: aminomethyltransferase family protein, partial [Leptospirales bacterium]